MAKTVSGESLFGGGFQSKAEQEARNLALIGINQQIENHITVENAARGLQLVAVFCATHKSHLTPIDLVDAKNDACEAAKTRGCKNAKTVWQKAFKAAEKTAHKDNVEPDSDSDSESTRPTLNASLLDLPSGFTREDGRLCKLVQKGEEKGTDGETRIKWETIPFCTEFQFIGQSQSQNGDNTGLVIKYIDRKYQEQIRAIPSRMIQGDGRELREQLSDIGIHVNPVTQERRYFSELIYKASEMQTLPSYVSTEQMGWCDGSFVLGDETIGNHADGHRVIYQSSNPNRPPISQNGKLDDWIENVGSLAVGNPNLMAAFCVSFAAPCSRLTAASSGFTLHYSGTSSGGKTSILHAASSIYGKPSDYYQTWAGTAVGHEARAAASNDLPSIIDELQNAERGLGSLVYRLHNGSEKLRGARDGTARKAKHWRLVALSSGEISLNEKLNEYGETPMAGMGVRFIDVPISGAFGAFDELHNRKNGQELADDLRRLGDSYYGTVGYEWITKLVTNSDAQNKINEAIGKFVQAVVKPEHSNEVQRVAQHFGLMAAAGELATSYNLTGWKRRQAWNTIKKLFEQWVKGRAGGAGSSDLANILNQLDTAITTEPHKFPNEKFEAAREELGFRASNLEHGNVICLHQASIPLICKNRNPKLTIERLANAGVLVMTEKKGTQLRKIRKWPREGRPADKNKRYIVISMDALNKKLDEVRGDADPPKK